MSHFHPNLHTVAALLIIPLLGLIGISAASAPADGAHPTPWTRCSKAAGDAAARAAGLAQALDADPVLRRAFGSAKPSETYKRPATSLCGDFDGDGQTDRAVLYQCCTVSSPAPWAVLRRRGKTWRVAHARLHDPTFKLEGDGTRLITTEPKYASGDANCCPSRLKVGTLRWTGHAFTRSFRLVDASKAPGGGSAARAATTRLITYWPFAQDGSVRPGLKIVRRHGQCWTTPEATVAHRAFRCMAGNYIHDPCFEPPGGLDPNDPSVVCADDPWAHTVIRLHLDHDTEVRAASNADPRVPWAMRLANGQRCLLQQGASMVDGAGRRLNYVCASPSSRRQLWLFGHVDRAHGTWRIRAGEPRSDGDVGSRYAAREGFVAILTAWR